MLSELPATILGRVAVWRPGKHVAVPVVPKLFEQTIPTVNDVRLVQYRVNVFIRHHPLPPRLRLRVCGLACRLHRPLYTYQALPAAA